MTGPAVAAGDAGRDGAGGAVAGDTLGATIGSVTLAEEPATVRPQLGQKTSSRSSAPPQRSQYPTAGTANSRVIGVAGGDAVALRPHPGQKASPGSCSSPQDPQRSTAVVAGGA
jgi:hypothetical protein